ncbi:hypothetical protein KXW10_008051 [Aspergillus fumigatus]|nr:hypothetical protein KXW10_008051 [Aspergillus fumigatus]
MLAPHIDQRSLDSKTMVAVKKRTAQHAKLAAFMNAGPDEIDQILNFPSDPCPAGLWPLHNGSFAESGRPLRPSLNADSEIVVSGLCHEADVAAFAALAKTLGISIRWWAQPGEWETTGILSLASAPSDLPCSRKRVLYAAGASSTSPDLLNGVSPTGLSDANTNG